MHIFVATLYAIVIWLSLLSYTIILGGFVEDRAVAVDTVSAVITSGWKKTTE